MALSATEAAFEGFRVARERPLAVLAWAVVQLARTLASTAIIVGLGGPAFEKLMHEFLSPTPNPQAVAALMPDLLPAFGLATLVGITASAVLNPAVYRTVLNPKDRGLLSLKFGLDELRQLGVSLGLTIVFSLVYVACLIAAGMLGALLSIAGPAASVLGMAVGVTGTICLMVWLVVRLSLAGPLSFDRKKLDLFGSWALTRGRFFALFSAYLLALVMAGVVSLLCLAIIGAVAAALNGAGLSSGVSVMGALGAGAIKLADLFSPLRLVVDALSAVAGALSMAIVSGACANVYAQVRGPGASVF